MPPRRSRSSVSIGNTPRRATRRAVSIEPEHDQEDLEHPLDRKEPEDDEYQGADDDEDEDIEDTESRKKRSFSRNKEQDDEEDEDDDDLDLDDDDDDDDDESNSKRQKSNSGTPTPNFTRRGPGRGKKGPMIHTPIQPPQEEDLGPLEMENDEYILPEDEEGETKISKLGELQNNRQFRVRTFKVMGKGDRLYMLSTEPARCMGFRDSYLLFQKHRKLYKIVLTFEEKFDLINRDIIPHSYKGRVIGLVTARSIFREFGAKIIVGGRNITDDYYSIKLKQQGQVIEGELAEPEDPIPPKGIPYNINQFVAWHGASSVYHGGVNPNPQPIQPIQESLELKSMKALKATNHINEENWMYQHALAIRDFEKSLLSGRSILSKGLRDSYTGLQFIPNLTQPTIVNYKKLINEKNEHNGFKKKLIYETKIHSGNFVKKTGLINVPLEIFENVDDEIKNAILKQQRLERDAR